LSEAPPTALDVDGLAQWLDEWMAVAGIERVALVGHSLGCQVAVEAALRHPERVERLVLVGPTTDPAERSTVQQFARFLAGGLFERPALTWHAACDYWRMGRRLVPEFRAMLQDRVEGKLPLLEIPTLVVRGEHDPIAPQRWVDNVAGLIDSSSTAIIPGWGHAVQYSAAEHLAPVIEAFLERE
jgi:2-hydroxy-6-oxonona-2,4-dienedioate hydrolase